MSFPLVARSTYELALKIIADKELEIEDLQRRIDKLEDTRDRATDAMMRNARLATFATPEPAREGTPRPGMIFQNRPSMEMVGRALSADSLKRAQARDAALSAARSDS